MKIDYKTPDLELYNIEIQNVIASSNESIGDNGEVDLYE